MSVAVTKKTRAILEAIRCTPEQREALRLVLDEVDKAKLREESFQRTLVYKHDELERFKRTRVAITDRYRELRRALMPCAGLQLVAPGKFTVPVYEDLVDKAKALYSECMRLA